MTRNVALIVAAVASTAVAGAIAARSEPPQTGKALLVVTGHESEIRAPRIELARSQDVFDGIWIRHMGERVTKAAQGWPMTPQIDFAACSAIFIFGGDTTNANGYRVLDVVTEPDAVTVR